MLVIQRRGSQRTIITTPAGEEIIIENLGKDRIGIDAPGEYVIARDRHCYRLYSIMFVCFTTKLPAGLPPMLIE